MPVLPLLNELLSPDNPIAAILAKLRGAADQKNALEAIMPTATPNAAGDVGATGGPSGPTLGRAPYGPFLGVAPTGAPDTSAPGLPGAQSGANPDGPDYAGPPPGSENSSISTPPVYQENSSLTPNTMKAVSGSATAGGSTDLGPSFQEKFMNFARALGGEDVEPSGVIGKRRNATYDMLKSGKYGTFTDEEAQNLARNPDMMNKLFSDRFKSPELKPIGVNDSGYQNFGFVNNATQTVKPIEGSANSDNTPVDQIADAIIKGDQPPTLTGLYKQGAGVRAALARKGFNLETAQLEDARIRQQVKSLNGVQNTKFITLAGTVQQEIDRVGDLADQLDQGGIPKLNYLKLQAYAQTNGNSQQGQLTAKYLTAVNNLKETFAQASNGGYAPTDPAWKLADQQVNGDYGRDQLKASLGEVRRAVGMRVRAISDFGGIGPGSPNRYLPGGQPGGQAPGNAQAPTAQVLPEAQHQGALAEARVKISKGADPALVKQRLLQLGVDPKELGDAGAI